jgi:two-component system response regulator YesN
LINYIVRNKMEYAARLLASPRYKVYEVCGRVGYKSNRYFAQAFKKHMGITPTEFRRAAVKKSEP